MGYCNVHDSYNGNGVCAQCDDERLTVMDYKILCEEKDEDIEFMLDVIKEIYSTCGEDSTVRRLCNKALTSRISIDRA